MAALVCFTASAQTTAQPTSAMTETALRTLLETRIAEKRAVGIAVAIVEPSGDIRVVNAGHAGGVAPSLRAVADDTIFEIGSITKGYTGILLAQMVARGEVTLEDTVRMHAPTDISFPTGGVGDITLRALATHTSGLPRLPVSMAFLRSMATDPTNPYANYQRADFWAYLVGREHDATRSYAAAYSNLGMGLLGELLANRAGLTFDELVQRNILRPLRLNETYITVPAVAKLREAEGHDDKGRPTPHWDLPAMAGAGALRATARDVAKLMLALSRGDLQHAGAAVSAHAKMGERSEVGLGWMILKSRGEEVVWHNGGTGGFRSFAGYSRLTGRAVIVLSNMSAEVDDIGLHLINAAFPLQPKPEGVAVWNSGSMVVGVITALVWLSAVMAPIRAKFSAALAEPTMRVSRWRKIFVPRYVHSRMSAGWMALEEFAIAGLLYSFGPWSVLGQAAKWVMLTTLAVAAFAAMWRARALPWRATARVSASQVITRAVTALMVLGLITLWMS
jgi:CubicO group peptidase (beta-lactamase class C family)